MYQNIDDTETDKTAEGQAEPVQEASRTAIFLAIAIGIALLVFVTIVSGDRSGKPSDLELSKAEQRADYLSALASSKAALRRARLTDLLNTYPDHKARNAIQAQLQVLDEKEASDWAHLTNILYDPESDDVQKTIALDHYIRDWGTNLVGGRESEIDRIRTELTPPETIQDEDSATTPDPDFTPEDKANFSENVPSDVMAGGVVTITRGTYARPEIIETRPRPQLTKIIDPEIRRNVTPRYPSKALRRNVGAVVTLSLYIDDDGDVEMTELVSVSAPRYKRDFVRAAERAALRTKFHPKRVNDRPVAASGVIRRYVFDPDN